MKNDTGARRELVDQRPDREWCLAQIDGFDADSDTVDALMARIEERLQPLRFEGSLESLLALVRSQMPGNPRICPRLFDAHLAAFRFADEDATEHVREMCLVTLDKLLEKPQAEAIESHTLGADASKLVGEMTLKFDACVALINDYWSTAAVDLDEEANEADGLRVFKFATWILTGDRTLQVWQLGLIEHDEQIVLALSRLTDAQSASIFESLAGQIDAET